jgi:hypothetical protein
MQDCAILAESDVGAGILGNCDSGCGVIGVHGALTSNTQLSPNPAGVAGAFAARTRGKRRHLAKVGIIHGTRSGNAATSKLTPMELAG